MHHTSELGGTKTAKQMKKSRSSCPEMLCQKKTCLKFCKIHRKTLALELLLSCLNYGSNVFSCEFSKVSKITYFVKHL